MQVILKQNVAKLGRRGQVVNVKPGYARNYLFPREIAIKVSPGALKQLQLVISKIDLEEAQKRKEHEVVAARLSETTVMINVSANEEGHLYGSVGPKEIALALREKGFELEASSIELEKTIKQVGPYKVSVDLYHEVTAQVTLYVVGPGGMGLPKEEGKEGKQETEAQGAALAAPESVEKAQQPPEAPQAGED